MSLAKHTYFFTYTVMGVLLFAALSVSTTASANRWGDYYGNRSFDLRDDYRLRDLQSEARDWDRKVERQRKRVRRQQKDVRELKKRVGKLGKRIQKLTDQTLEAINKKEKLKEQKERLEGKISDLKRSVRLAKRTVQSTSSDVNKKENQLVRVKQRLKKAREECREKQTEECQRKVRRLQRRKKRVETQLADARDLHQSAEEDLEEKRENLKNTNRAIAKKTQQIQNIEKQNSKRSQKISQLKSNKKQKRNKLKKNRRQLKRKVTRLNNLKNEYDAAHRRMVRYRRNLVDRVLEANHRGLREGENDGADDGHSLAQEMGMNQGDTDGYGDGQNDGISDGRQRDYDRGYGQGEIDGEARAEREGKEDGIREGTRQGNIDAATREGEAAGTQRAQNSDAAQVGTRQGEEDGYERADRTGERRGSPLGEEQAIAEYENRSLGKTQADGQYSGAFSRNVPRFPRNYTGRSFDPDRYYGRDVVARAYTDGYLYGYEYEVKYVFDQNIAGIYNDAYDAAYDRAYDEYYNQSYPDSRDQGYDDGEQDAYDRVYPGVYDKYFEQYREKFSSSPNRDSQVFKDTYARVEQSTYERVYEEIRQANYDDAEQRTFDENIDERTEHYRKKRFAEVEKIYKENAVLKFVSSSTVDGGLEGVAAKDGVYQPGETVFHNVTLKNFGKMAANDSKVVLSNGKTAKLPSIAPGSVVTVKGAAKSRIQSKSTGSAENKALSVKASLEAEAKIQGRHYANVGEAVVGNDQKRLKVNYPFNLSGLGANGTIVYDEKKNLNVTVTNSSERSYRGPLKVELSVDSKGQALSRQFEEIENIGQTSKTLKKAQVFVQDERDAYRELRFQAVLKKQGVIVGSAANFVTMIKARYLEKEGATVLVANSEKKKGELLDLIDRLGGLTKVSVFDTSLDKRNASVVKKGLKGKVLLFVSDNGGSAKSMSKLLENSKRLAFVTVDGNGRSAKRLKRTRAFNTDRTYKLDLTGFNGKVRQTLSNAIVNNALEDDAVILEGDLKNFKDLVRVASYYTLRNKEIMKKVNKSVTRDNFFGPSDEQKQLGQVMNARILNEIIRAGVAYDKDEEDDDYIAKDNSTLVYQLAKKVDSDNNPGDKKIGIFMMAMDSFKGMKYLIEENPFEDWIPNRVANHALEGGWGVDPVMEPMDEAYEAVNEYEDGLSYDIRNKNGLYRPVDEVSNGNTAGGGDDDDDDPCYGRSCRGRWGGR